MLSRLLPDVACAPSEDHARVSRSLALSHGQCERSAVAGAAADAGKNDPPQGSGMGQVRRFRAMTARCRVTNENNEEIFMDKWSGSSVTYAVAGRRATITLNRPDRLNAIDALGGF